MPLIVLPVTGGTTRLPVYAGREVSPGMLFGLCARIAAGTSKTGRTHIQAGIYKGAADGSQLVSIMLDDYVYDGHFPTWTGKVPLETGSGIIAICRSADGVTVEIIGNILKHDP